MSESVNGRSHYQSDFNDGQIGIWWCGEYWMISETSHIGQCTGLASTIYGIDEICVHNVGWNWEYVDYDVGAWNEAGQGLGVRCTGMH